MTWEERKSRARELDEKKRRRQSVVEEGEKPAKRQRKMKFTPIEEQWGEEAVTEQEIVGAGTTMGGAVGDSWEQELGSYDCDVGNDNPCKRIRLATPASLQSILHQQR